MWSTCKDYRLENDDLSYCTKHEHHIMNSPVFLDSITVIFAILSQRIGKISFYTICLVFQRELTSLVLHSSLKMSCVINMNMEAATTMYDVFNRTLRNSNQTVQNVWIVSK